MIIIRGWHEECLSRGDFLSCLGRDALLSSSDGLKDGSVKNTDHEGTDRK
jgi:hypothetical protein